MNGTELKSLSHFQILTWIAYSYISRNLGNWLILKFFFIPCKTVNVSQEDQIRMKHVLQVFSWWMEQNQEVLVIFEFLPWSHTRTLAENLKID